MLRKVLYTFHNILLQLATKMLLLLQVKLHMCSICATTVVSNIQCNFVVSSNLLYSTVYCTCCAGCVVSSHMFYSGVLCSILYNYYVIDSSLPSRIFSCRLHEAINYILFFFLIILNYYSSQQSLIVAATNY